MDRRFSPCKNQAQLARNVGLVVKIHSMLTEQSDLSYYELSLVKFDFPGYDNDLVRSILTKGNQYSQIGSYRKNLENIVGGLAPGPTQNYIRYYLEAGVNIIEFQEKKDHLCSECKSELQLVKYDKICPKCLSMTKTMVIEDLDEEIEPKLEKKNILKHYEETLKKIYGAPPKSAVLPDEVIEKFRIYLNNRHIDIRDSLHYTYTLLEYMKEAGVIRWGGVGYKIKKYKNQVNYILIKLYPDLKIPELTIKQLTILTKAFMAIARKFRSQNPNKYGNNYMYTVFKIIHLMMPYNDDARELLRFIFIQKPCSFKEKDEKLKRVNDIIEIFPVFKYTPEDVYGREDFYQKEAY